MRNTCKDVFVFNIIKFLSHMFSLFLLLYTVYTSEVACSRVKSRDDPISGRRGDSGVLYSFIYKDATNDGEIRGADPGGAGGAAAPPISILVVQTYHFAPPIIPVHK